MMWWGWGGPFMMGGLFMWLVPALLIGLIVWALTGSRRTTQATHDEGAALETLKMRLAKGEIGEEEYQRLKGLLK